MAQAKNGASFLKHGQTHQNTFQKTQEHFLDQYNTHPLKFF